MAKSLLVNIDFRFESALGARYKSATQTIRVLSEGWWLSMFFAHVVAILVFATQVIIWQ